MFASRLSLVAALLAVSVSCGGESDRDRLVSAGGSFGSGMGGGGGVGGSGANAGAPSDPIPPPAGPFPTATEAAAACQQPGQVVDVFDATSIRAWLVRRWFFCSGSYIFLDEHAGIEFAADGKWYFLDLVEGELVRRQGFDGGGNWSFQENTTMPVPDAFTVQVNIDRFSGGGLGGFVRFAVSPLKVNLSMGGAGPTEYLAVGP